MKEEADMKGCPLTAQYDFVMVVWLVVAALVPVGCASPDKDRCIDADWQKRGYEDGTLGRSASHIDQHHDACAAQGLAPDVDRYENGRRQGLLVWCTEANGYRLGMTGKQYNGVCPRDLTQAFMEAFNQGRAILDYEAEILKQEGLHQTKVNELDALDRHIKSKEAELTGRGVSPRRRMKLKKETRQLQTERRVLVHEIEDMAFALKDMRNHLERMRAAHPYR